MNVVSQDPSAKDSNWINNYVSDQPSEHNQKDPYRIVYFALFFYVAVSFCDVLWKSSSSATFQIFSYILYPTAFIAFFFLSIACVVRQKTYQLCSQSHLVKLKFYTFLVTMLLLYGLIRGNHINAIIHEMILFYSLFVFLILGVDDRVCNSLIKFMTLIFWAAFVLSLLTFDIQSPSVAVIPGEGVEGFDRRYDNSIAYGYFRPFIQLSLPLFLLGWLEKKRGWHYLQICSLPGYFLVNVGIFKFRGALVFCALVALATLIMPSSLKRKMKIICFTLIVAFFAAGWIYTKSGSVFVERAQQFDSSKKVIDYRLPELEFYFKTIGFDWLWGRGLGGTFFSRVSAKMEDPVNIRTGIHIGWISLTLKGGLPLLLLILAFFSAGIRKNKQRMKNEPYYVIARYWIPIFFVNWLVNPITFHAAMVPVYGLTFLFLAQYGKRPIFNKNPD